MKSRAAVELLAGALVLGCGGGVFSADGLGDGTDASVIADGSADAGVGGSPGTGGGSSGGTGTGGSAGAIGDGGAAGAGGAAGDPGTGGTAGSPGTGGSVGTGGAAGGAGAGGSVGTGGGGVDWKSCAGPGLCTEELKGCCAPCGTPQVGDFAGVNVNRVSDFRAETCTNPNPQCMECLTGNNPNIGARCVNRQCEAFDVRKVPEYSACSTNSDCQIRAGTDCCPCGGAVGWVAVSASGWKQLGADVCAANSACPSCGPANVEGACIKGHCEVVGASGVGSCPGGPGAGCCANDAACGLGHRCYGAACGGPESQGVCELVPPPGKCWGDRDCAGGLKCHNAILCSCGLQCLAPDMPGSCQ